MNLPIIKRFWRNAHAPCHVTQGRWVTNSHIFGIPDPILPIHFGTFKGLQWQLRVVYWWASPLWSVVGAMRMRRVTWPKVGGLQITTYLESPTPYGLLPIHFETFKRLRWQLGVVYWWASPLWSVVGAMRMRRVTWPNVGGSQITTYLESPTPYCLFTLELSRGCGDN